MDTEEGDGSGVFAGDGAGVGAIVGDGAGVDSGVGDGDAAAVSTPLAGGGVEEVGAGTTVSPAVAFTGSVFFASAGGVLTGGATIVGGGATAAVSLLAIVVAVVDGPILSSSPLSEPLIFRYSASITMRRALSGWPLL